jgi:transposase
MTIVEKRAFSVTGGVDTHADGHVAAALDSIGGLLGTQSFPITPAGYARLLSWLQGFGALRLVGIEGTGSYGAGLARHMAGAGVQVVEIDRSGRQDRRRAGKSDVLVAAGDHPERLRSDAAWAHLCGAAPIPASSGKRSGRYRLNPGGDHQANHALWRIVITRMGSHPPTQAYVERRLKEGLSKVEIIRCLKRSVARAVYRHLRLAAD